MNPHETIGHYRILSKLGEGGMGAVYRATDTRLGREVAVKVLPPAFAEDTARMQRFEREAQVLASVNHPNIAAIYGIEQAAIIMELVEGEDLKGPASVEAAIGYARQIAAGLEAAHEKGIVHRDLKPANIKVTPDGIVKLLDFGLAKISETGASPASAANPTFSPTLSLQMTQAGMILGTAAYMSPEQARGKPVDKRADIWAFGVILYEMLAGKPLFAGADNLTDIIAAVVTAEPDWSALPADTPPRLRRLLAQCLRKDPKQRLRDIGDARLMLEDWDAQPPSAPAPITRRHSTLPWALAAVMALAAGAAWWRAQVPEPKQPIRFDVTLGSGAVAGNYNPILLTPDGSRILFARKNENGQVALYSRSLDQPTANLVSGTELPAYVGHVAFSPDGQSIAFFRGRLYKVSVAGGAPAALCDTSYLAGLDWSDPRFLYFGGDAGRLYRIPPSGGTPETLTDPTKSGDIEHLFPQALPGGRYLLFTAVKRADIGTNDIKALDLRTHTIQRVLSGAALGRYLPSGHLVFLRANTLYAVRFDLGTLTPRGTPQAILDDVASDPDAEPPPFDISRNGTMIYVPGKADSAKFPMAWMQSDGTTKPILPANSYMAPAFSPDGKRLAYSVAGDRGVDLWVYDLERETPVQLTFEATRFLGPEVAWTPDGKHIVYSGAADNKPAMLWIRSDGSGQPYPLLADGIGGRPHSFSPDGRTLAYSVGTNGLPDLWTVSVDAADPEHPKVGKPNPYLTTPNVEVDAAFSPDGRWIAYASSESGREELFVRPFPADRNGGKVRVSSGGGKFPSWSRNGRELFFLGGDDRIQVVTYQAKADSIDFSKPRAWSDTRIFRTLVYRNLDLHPDGKRFLVFPLNTQDTLKGDPNQVTVILNFFEELRRKVP